MPDYSKGKVYKVLNSIDDEIYVGSTCEALGQRMSKHRYNMKKQPHYNLYKHMNELDVENFYIELIEHYPCNDVYELRAREGHFIREHGTLNKVISGRSEKQYYEDNKENYTKYYKDNRERMLYLMKQYNENNKEYIMAYNKEEIACVVCGCLSSRCHMASHQRSMKCKSHVKPVDNE